MLIRFGYGTQVLPESELNKRWTWSRLHPELRLRLLGLFAEKSTVGIGSGARSPSAQLVEFLRRHSKDPIPNRPSRRFQGQTYYLKPGMAPYAPPGSSNHEDGVYEGYAVAADLVGWEDGWLELNAKRFGLKTFKNVNNEPWHVQPIEMPNSRISVDNWVLVGQKLSTWVLPRVEPADDLGESPMFPVLPEGVKMHFKSVLLYDTRKDGYKIPIVPGGTLRFDLKEHGVPKDAKGAFVNVTPVSNGERGNVMLYGKEPETKVSSANYSGQYSEATPNLAITDLDDGVFHVEATSEVHLVLALRAWF